jgi:hypothetical protein
VKISPTSKTFDKSDFGNLSISKRLLKTTVDEAVTSLYSDENWRPLKRSRSSKTPPEGKNNASVGILRGQNPDGGESLLNWYEKEGEKEEKVGCQTPR